MKVMDINKNIHNRKSSTEVVAVPCERVLITLLTGRFAVLDIIFECDTYEYKANLNARTFLHCLGIGEEWNVKVGTN